MRYALFIAAIFAFFLVGCGDDGGKPGQYPPSSYQGDEGERLGAPSGQK